MNGNGKPRFHMAVEHLDKAHEHMDCAMTILSSVIFDLQKGANFIASYRDSLVKTIEASGGDVAMAIEQQIQDFVQPKYRQPVEAKDEQTPSSS